ncbi:AIPR family protein [Roseibium sp.]|uniref:AIPR family protein n=1 Tax=Roseibium sp. TaxID=1936156 RepID=UPI003BAF83F8
MSKVTLQRIRSALIKKYENLIDLSDLADKSKEERETCLVSRALAADYIRNELDCNPERASQFVTDGYDDNSIDAFHFDAMDDTLYVVTSRWSKSGKSKFDLAEIEKFAAGVRRFLNTDLTKFNNKFHRRKAEIDEALFCERRVRIVVCVVHTGEQPLNEHCMRPLTELADEINAPVEICSVRQRSQAGVYDMITAHVTDPPVQLQITLEDWGQLTHPYEAYYGKVSADQIAAWWRDHKSDLFTKNLRLYYPNSIVNRSIRKTIATSPRDFWYFNNGLTLIAEKIVKGIGGSTKRAFGNFTCHGASIVNGAQTVGAIGAEADQLQDSDEHAYVHVRLISLESCRDNFALDVTRATNLQNAVGTREFASLDPNQHRLALDFQLDGRKYVYRSGDSEPIPSLGCTLQEATQALGCRLSVGVAVEVKREIGAIWADPKSKPYTEIFPKDLSATTVWRCVNVMREVDEFLQSTRANSDIEPRRAMVAAHLNRLILHIVLTKPTIARWLSDYSSSHEIPSNVLELTKEIFISVVDYVDEKYEGSYLGSLAKNREKCQEIVDVVTGKTPENQSNSNQIEFPFDH